MTASDRPAEPIDLSFVVPAFNEAEGIADALRRVVGALRDIGCRFEVIVVDDGSTDGTFAEAQSLTGEYGEVRIVQHPKNRGFVEAMLTGYRASRGDVVLADAADLAFDPADMKQVLARIDAGADVVVVERMDRAAYGVVRKVISVANVRLVRLLFRVPFEDYNFVQAYRRAVLDEVEVVTRGVSTLAAEMIVRAYRRGFTFNRVRCPYHERTFGKSSITLRDVVHSTTQLMRLWFVMRRAGSSSRPAQVTNILN